MKGNDVADDIVARPLCATLAKLRTSHHGLEHYSLRDIKRE